LTYNFPGSSPSSLTIRNIVPIGSTCAEHETARQASTDFRKGKVHIIASSALATCGRMLVLSYFGLFARGACFGFSLFQRHNALVHPSGAFVHTGATFAFGVWTDDDNVIMTHALLPF
jgi:hypothetical protein